MYAETNDPIKKSLSIVENLSLVIRLVDAIYRGGVHKNRVQRVAPDGSGLLHSLRRVQNSSR